LEAGQQCAHHATHPVNLISKNILLGMPTFQLYSGVFNFVTISSAFKLVQSWRLKIFPLVPPLIFKLIIKNVQKLSFGSLFKHFSPALTR